MARPPTPKSPATAADPRSTISPARRHDPPRWGRAGPTGTCTPMGAPPEGETRGGTEGPRQPWGASVVISPAGPGRQGRSARAGRGGGTGRGRQKTKEKRREGQELDRGSVRSPPAGSVRSPPAGKGKGLGFRSQGPPLGEAQKGQRRPAGRKRTEPAGWKRTEPAGWKGKASV